ncbi:MAG: Hpt domain-containing protein [Thermodesulfobacteriota bacterium]
MHIIDYNKLVTMFAGDRAKVDSLLAALNKRIPEWQEELEEASAQPYDREKIRQICHKISGAAGTITAEKTAHLTESLRTACKTGDDAAITDRLEQLHHSLIELISFTPPPAP